AQGVRGVGGGGGAVGRGFLFPRIVVTASARTGGCASRRYVRQRVEPVNNKTADLDKRSAENASAIQALEDKTQRGIGRVDEKIAAVDAKAGDAARAAGQANTQATQAGEKADAARTLAESGVAKTNQLEKTIENL